jgi:putative transposase
MMAYVVIALAKWIMIKVNLTVPFRPRRHRLSAEEYRREMDTRFTTWNEVTGTATAAA